MKENTQEKNLIEKNKENILEKMRRFIKKIFGKKENIMIDNEEESSSVNNEFKTYIKMAEDEEAQLLELQRKYREGKIAKDELTDEQIDLLCDLYDKQIAELRIAIDNTKKQIAEYDKKTQKKNT